MSISSMFQIAGTALIAAGLLLLLLRRVPYFRNEPGDLYWSGRTETLWFALTVCAILGIILALAMNFLFRLLKP
jgi:ribose/xylose/arabinose/galactoside ABC-type transport system permease subunit